MILVKSQPAAWCLQGVWHHVKNVQASLPGPSLLTGTDGSIEGHLCDFLERVAAKKLLKIL